MAKNIKGIIELRTELDRRRKESNEIEKSITASATEDRIRRGKANVKQLDTFITAGFKALSIDPKIIAEQHEADAKMASKVHAKNRVDVKKLHAIHKERTKLKQIALMKIRDSLEKDKKSGDPDPLILCLWIADAVKAELQFDYKDGYFFQGSAVPIGAGENKLSCQVGSKGTGIIKYDIIHDFSWMSDRTGMMDMEGGLDIIGDFDLRACGSCSFGVGQDAAADIRYQFSISQMQSGSLLELSTPWIDFFHSEVSAGCSTSEKSGAMSSREVPFSLGTPFPVMANLAVNFRVITQLWAESTWWSGNPDPYADMFFQEINVPAIIGTVS